MGSFLTFLASLLPGLVNSISAFTASSSVVGLIGLNGNGFVPFILRFVLDSFRDLFSEGLHGASGAGCEANGSADPFSGNPPGRTGWIAERHVGREQFGEDSIVEELRGRGALEHGLS